MTAGGEPRAGRPRMPAGYGVPEAGAPGTLGWAWATGRLAAARTYWVCTGRPDGRPHAMPVWGIWADGVLRFGTDRGSRKARNLARRPAVVAHLESGEETVILEGTAVEVTDPAVLGRFADAFAAKYDTRLADVPGDLVIYEVRPAVVLAWREADFPASATRWRLTT